MNENSFGLKQVDVSLIKNILASYKQIDKAVIFGSRSTGNYRHGSDVDLAIYTHNKDLRSKISLTLNEETLLPYHFDVVDFYTLTYQNLIDQINRTGIVIYTK